MEPYQTGQGRFEMNYRGSESDGASKAQEFCRQRGFDFAHINYTVEPDLDTAWRMGVGLDKRHVAFFCLHNGDKIEYPPAPALVLVPVP